MPLLTQQRQRPAQGAGPLTRPRRPRLAVVRWLPLDSCLLWCYTGLATSHCFHTLSIAALGPAADAVERREKAPHRSCHPVGGFLASGALGGLWGKGPQWALPLLVHLAGGLMSRPAERPRRGLALASDRRSDTPPQRAYLCAPAARKAGKGPACGALAGGVQIAAPPQGQGLQQQPAAGAPARLGGGTPSEGPRAATPARRAGPEGRTAPQPPLCGGRAAPEHLRRNRHGGGAMQGRASGPPRRGLALHCGGVPPCNGWRPT